MIIKNKSDIKPGQLLYLEQKILSSIDLITRTTKSGLILHIVIHFYLKNYWQQSTGYTYYIDNHTLAL